MRLAHCVDEGVVAEPVASCAHVIGCGVDADGALQAPLAVAVARQLAEVAVADDDGLVVVVAGDVGDLVDHGPDSP